MRDEIKLTDAELSNLLWALQAATEELEANLEDPQFANARGLLAIKLEEITALRIRLSSEYEDRGQMADYEASQRRILET